MGVSWTARILAPAGLDRRRAQAAVQAALNDIVEQMSGWEPGSDLSRFNAAAAGTRQRLPAAMARVIERGIYWARESGGAFDPTLARLTDLWGFGPAGPAANPPAPDAVEAALAQGGWERIDLTEDGLLQPGGLGLDLSGIAKGYGLDAAANVLVRLGVRDYLIEIGGELIGAGVKADGSPWWVDVEAPPGLDPPAPPLRLALHGLAVATSGDYRRFARQGDRRIAHSLDPRTGRPLDNGVVSATALAATGMDADAIATILMVMGPEQGMAFAADRGIAAVMLHRHGETQCEAVSPALQDMLV